MLDNPILDIIKEPLTTLHAAQLVRITSGAPRGFVDLERMAIYFQGAGGALVIIFRDLGSKLIVLGI